MARITNSKVFLLVLLLSSTFVFSAQADLSSNFTSCVQQNETSGMTPTQAAANHNQYGYTGQYQRGVNYVGGYLCSNYASIPNMPKQQDWSQCDFKGTLAKSMGITSYAAFTTGPKAVAAQNYILQQVSQQTWNQIVSRGDSSYLG